MLMVMLSMGGVMFVGGGELGVVVGAAAPVVDISLAPFQVAIDTDLVTAASLVTAAQQVLLTQTN